MSNNGLHNDEITKLLFKNYMNSTSTSDSKAFFEESGGRYGHRNHPGMVGETEC